MALIPTIRKTVRLLPVSDTEAVELIVVTLRTLADTLEKSDGLDSERTRQLTLEAFAFHQQDVDVTTHGRLK